MSEFDEKKWLEENINEILALGLGRMSSCSGCCETVDGHNSLGHPYSKVFDCLMGGGCDECQGTGIVQSDYTDYPLFTENQELRQALRNLTYDVFFSQVNKGVVTDTLWSRESKCTTSFESICNHLELEVEDWSNMKQVEEALLKEIE